MKLMGDYKKLKKLTLIELNEINLDIADSYIEKLNLEGFKKLKLLNSLKTNSEKKYELLEPWIQWHSIHTGLSAQEHGLFRLGDTTKNKNKNIFELLDSKGLKIGVISAMNILNNFKHAAFFIPDPWTSTHSGETFWEKKISKFLNQTVNDNSKNKIRLLNYLYILLTFLRFARFKNYLSCSNEKYGNPRVISQMKHFGLWIDGYPAININKDKKTTYSIIIVLRTKCKT